MLSLFYALCAISPVIVLVAMVLNARKEYRRENLVEGFMKHIRAGDMEAAGAYWEEHFGQQPLRKLTERDQRWAALSIKAGMTPGSVSAFLSRRRISEADVPLLDAWEESGLQGEELRDFMLQTLRERKRDADSSAA
jgi:hypothetical protein